MSLITPREWESAIDRRHALYTAAGLALCERTTPPADRDAAGRLREVDDGPPDFAVTVDGRRVLVEAKLHGCGRKTWQLSRVRDGQGDAMDTAEAAAVLLRWAPPAADLDVVLLLPWTRLSPLWQRWRAGDAERGEASLSFSHANEIATDRWAVEWTPGEPHTCPDYLPALRQMEAP